MVVTLGSEGRSIFLEGGNVENPGSAHGNGDSRGVILYNSYCLIKLIKSGLMSN